MRWIDRISYLGLVGRFLFVLVAAPAVGAMLFFFPILQICEFFNWEFSNLGPIATFFWGILFDIFFATPAFVLLLIYKLLRQRTQSGT